MLRALLFVLLSASTTFVAAQTVGDLPDIGSPEEAALPKSDEYRIGLMIVRQLRDQGEVLDDPEAEEYLQSIGSRLAAQVGEDGQNFQFFIVKDREINAFALPGGFIGVNLGLILATSNESELASVLGHEMAHVVQRHIARSVEAQGRQSLASAAAILAAILIGAAARGGGNAMQAGVAVAQGSAIQQQINFTRSEEYEADRVGISFLAGAGFDPQAMGDFFATVGRRVGLIETEVPEFFQNHPVTSNRIAEARGRAAQYRNLKPHVDSLSYFLARERLRVLGMAAEEDPRPYYVGLHDRGAAGVGDQYGEALALERSGKSAEAVEILRRLVAENQGATLLWSALGQAEIAAGNRDAGLATLGRAMNLFPRNVPVAVRYAEALMNNGRAREAHDLLLDLFNNVEPTPEQIRLIALAASAAGDPGDAYFYMSEYHIGSGDLRLASQQLQLALSAPNLTPVQRKRFAARLQEVRDYLAQESKREARADSQGDGGGRRGGRGHGAFGTESAAPATLLR
jgi:predicted Zn-dependent protease